ncbi:MAG: motility associated factor glycosyltransferase family protein [Treponema sp.]
MNSPLTSTSVFVPDTVLFAKHYALFSERFPLLARELGIDTFEKAKKRFFDRPSSYALTYSKAGTGTQPTLVVHEKYIHSKYKPEEEARRLLSTDFFSAETTQCACVFAGLGLGYLPTIYAKTYPYAEIVIVEPDVHIFLCFLAAQLQHGLLMHQKLTLLIGVSAHEASSLLSASSAADAKVFQQSACIEVNSSWFHTFFTLRERVQAKQAVNAKTLERFGALWLNNTRKNLSALCRYPKIQCFYQAFKEVPAVILAGGPSLTRHLAVLKQHKQQYLTIAVDTALRACIRYTFMPDFILSFDPQYWNYLHTAGLDTSKSILISEASVFPAVLRQRYRAVFLASSSVPFAGYFEQTHNEQVKLAAGGSVATTAWDFARYMGANPIIMAGLDLSFPHNQTHFTGSTFETAAYSKSIRTEPVEMMNCRSLFSAFPSKRESYNGDPVLTDRRMLLYAWWFENMALTNTACKTYNFMPEGIKIPGIPPYTEADLQRCVEGAPARSFIQEQLTALVAQAYEPAFAQGYDERLDRVRATVRDLLPRIRQLEQFALTAQELCNRLTAGVSAPLKYTLTAKLNRLDAAMAQNKAKDLVSLLFFDTRMFGALKTDATSMPNVHEHARKIYQRMSAAAHTVYTALEKC